MTMQAGQARRHGLTADESRQLCRKVLELATADHTRVNVESGLSGFTRVAINRITTAGETTDVTVQVTSVFGKRVASVQTNRLDDDSLRRAVRDAEALAKLAPENPEYLPELGEQKYLDVDGYYASTGELATESRARAASLGINAADRAGAIAAGFIDMRAGSSAVATSNGLFAYRAGTGVASTLTIRTRDGQSSGWAGDEGADWSTIESERIADEAAAQVQRLAGQDGAGSR